MTRRIVCCPEIKSSIKAPSRLDRKISKKKVNDRKVQSSKFIGNYMAEDNVCDSGSCPKVVQVATKKPSWDLCELTC